MSLGSYCNLAKAKEISLKIVLYMVLVIIAAATLAPLIWAFSSSFRNDAEIFGTVSPFTIKSLIPQNPTFQSYINIFTLRAFYRPIFNTFFVAVLNIIVGILINALSGFAFAKFNFRFKTVLFMIVMISVMVPFEAIAIPLYFLINYFRWVDTYYALLMPAFANGLLIFLFKQFFEDIPDSLVESAMIDGAKWRRIFFQIMLPLSVPVLISASLMIFISQWEAFMWPLIAARSKSLKMIQVALTDFRLEHMTLWSELFAASIVTAVIPTLLLLPFQKYFIRGIAASGMKE